MRKPDAWRRVTNGVKHAEWHGGEPNAAERFNYRNPPEGYELAYVRTPEDRETLLAAAIVAASVGRVALAATLREMAGDAP